VKERTRQWDQYVADMKATLRKEQLRYQKDQQRLQGDMDKALAAQAEAREELTRVSMQGRAETERPAPTRDVEDEWDRRMRDWQAEGMDGGADGILTRALMATGRPPVAADEVAAAEWRRRVYGLHPQEDGHPLPSGPSAPPTYVDREIPMGGLPAQTEAPPPPVHTEPRGDVTMPDLPSRPPYVSSPGAPGLVAGSPASKAKAGIPAHRAPVKARTPPATTRPAGPTLDEKLDARRAHAGLRLQEEPCPHATEATASANHPAPTGPGPGAIALVDDDQEVLGAASPGFHQIDT
ncbi:unnamed protein product, partial [Symbiodinium sp. CCMP2456]